MSVYAYEKSVIDSAALGFDIKNSSIEKELDFISFSQGVVDIHFTSDLSQEEESVLASIVASNDGMPLSQYRIWCTECAKYFQVNSRTSPTQCPSCSSGSVSDVTDEQFAIRGYPVAIIPGLAGSYSSQISPAKKWSTHIISVPFQSEAAGIPSSISFTNVVMEGVCDLGIININKRGFKFRVTTSGNDSGFVEFDWEAVYE